MQNILYLLTYETEVDENGFGYWWALILGLIIAVVFFVLLLYRTIHAWRSCTDAVDAVCVELVPEVDEETGTTLYAPVWEYIFGGQLHRSSDGAAANVNVPKIGDHKTLYVDPEKPTEFRRKVPHELLFTILMAGVIVLIIWAMYEKRRLGGS